ISGVKDVPELQNYITQNDWSTLINDIFSEYFPLQKVKSLRDTAIAKVKELFKTQADSIRQKPKLSRTDKDKEFLKSKQKFIKTTSAKLRDFAYENSLLLMQHSIIFIDFYDALYSGDSGHLERSTEFFTVIFEGSGKRNYTRELLELQVDIKAVWTPLMKEIWLLNILVNLSGRENKLLAVDELCEQIVNMLKTTFNT
ncbi:hypothetical protein RUND412_009936, partial [Rhizina undulata]